MKSVTVTAALFIASMAVLARAYLLIKLLFLALFLLAFLWCIHRKQVRIDLSRRIGWFYLWTAILGMTWGLIGLLHPSNYVIGVYESLRLYVIWSAAFFLLYTLLKSLPSLRIFHIAMLTAGILIPLINFAAMFDQLSGLNLIPESVRQEMELEIGFWDGFIQFNAVNISSMFFVAPYLLALQLRSDAGKANSLLVKIALTLSLVLVALSGRRALWIVVAVTPCIVLALSRLTRSGAALRWKRLIIVFSAASIIGIGTLLVLPEGAFDNESITRFQQAFSSDDERTIQKPHLINSFMQAPILGSGFGGRSDYIRGDDRPWRYELTYHQMLFNLGMVGMTAIAALFVAYSVLTVKALRQSQNAVAFAFLVAFVGLLIGAYSNPYLSGFDSLFFVGLLPYLSATGERGY